MRCNAKLLGLLALAAVAAFSFSGVAQAQVVNSGASSTSSNSQVTMTATINKLINVQVNQGSSTLAHTMDPSLIDSASNVSSTDFQIRGNVITNDATADIQSTLSTLALNLANGGSHMTVNLSGTIGGTAVSTSAFVPTFTSNLAAIVVNGDIDESTFTHSLPTGNYAGTLTITTTIQ